MDELKARVVEFLKNHKVSIIAFGVGLFAGAVIL